MKRLPQLLPLTLTVAACLTALAVWAGQGRPGDTPRFSAQVEQVVVYASVYDRDSRLVSGLTQEDFAVFEDRVEQEITSFVQTEIPSTIGIVLDTSGSMRNKMRLVEEAIDLFLSLSHPQNELFFIRFDHQVELVENFTYDVEDIRDAIANVVIKGGTALYDALYLSVEKAREGNEPKKVILLFTDGEDKDSFYRHEEVVEKVRESDTQVFVVGFLDEDLSSGRGFFGLFKSQRQKVEDEMKTVAEVTGGQAFFPEEITELSSVFEQIAHELKNQYRLAYISSNPERDGAWRRIDVQMRDALERGLRVRARAGYYAPTDS
jgi:Ca-activated chloride channel homolog